MIIYGFGEEHPSRIARKIWYDIRDKIDYDTNSLRINYLHDELMDNHLNIWSWRKGSGQFWKRITSIIENLKTPQEYKDSWLKGVEYMKRTVSKEKEIIRKIEPDTIYHEGTQHVGFEEYCRRRGVKKPIVYLDEAGDGTLIIGSALAGLRDEYDRLQKERESKLWLPAIKNNLPDKTGLIIAGIDHLKELSPSVTRFHSLPQAIRDLGIEFRYIELRK